MYYVYSKDFLDCFRIKKRQRGTDWRQNPENLIKSENKFSGFISTAILVAVGIQVSMCVIFIHGKAKWRPGQRWPWVEQCRSSCRVIVVLLRGIATQPWNKGHAVTPEPQSSRIYNPVGCRKNTESAKKNIKLCVFAFATADFPE